MSYADFDKPSEEIRRLIDSARADGEVILRVDGRAVARVVPMPPNLARKPRVPGRLAGQFNATPDCWDPDPEIIRLFEDGDSGSSRPAGNP